MQALTTVALGTAAAFAAVNAGSFAAFSTFVMPALKDVGAPTGSSAMRAINVTAPRPFALTLPLGLLAGAGAAVLAFRSGPDAGWWASVGAVGAVGMTAITAAANIPLNNRLERWTPRDDAEWRGWVRPWTRANSARTTVGLGSVVAFVVSAALS
ncbi:anthrone oxygenase family protein [Demequina zhanjiangensis]|uniref:DUF1772 domain-containing protein n=1 Tax=Demequina zhanjiangensis TaxID=3051659 RepID=A0ABT8G4J2_9MICO|nr:anthrone oxygenase family protein [Demequina sp. SYSU T00b26]MDN4473932.1 DUF1772 domain-containing protein [Demequina sp. SYSU T00b26]